MATGLIAVRNLLDSYNRLVCGHQKVSALRPFNIQLTSHWLKGHQNSEKREFPKPNDDAANCNNLARPE